MSVNECAEIVRTADPDRFLAAMAAPPVTRAVLFPIYAFNAEIARAPWVSREPMIVEMRLQWWRDALDEIAAKGVVRRHEVTLPLAHVLDAAGADRLDDLIVARRSDLDVVPFGTADELIGYLDATAGGLMTSAARALGAAGSDAAIAPVARATGLARYLEAVPALTAANRRPLPEIGDIVDVCRSVRAAWPGGSLRRAVPRPGFAALLEAWEARATLDRAIADPGRIAAGTLRGGDVARRAALLRFAALGR